LVKLVRALDRGLDLLEILNQNDGADIALLSDGADLPRGTAYRMMETLIARGLVTKGSDGASYWLTKQVRDLSNGFTEDSLLVQVAGPILDALCEKTEWPISLTLPLGIRMVVRAHTDVLTPLVLVKIPIGHTVPMINSAAGLAYLAHCTENQRDVLLNMIFESPAADSFEEALRDRSVVDSVIRETQDRGYSYLSTDKTHAAMGVPIIFGEGPVSALSVRYFTSAVSKADAVKLHLDLAKKAASEISEAWSTLRNQG
jgi:IclR family transcriptional regulator, mhp operon transcriptional activator